ncbi:MAG: c-type cytochrome [Bacteroidia bacterium]
MKPNLKRMFAVATLVAASSLTMSFTTSSPSGDKPAGKPWKAPENAVKMKNPAKGADALKEGKDLYMQHCKSCHGAKGKGDGPKAEKIDISCNDFSKAEFKTVSDGEMYWKTTEGRKPMPSFKEKLSDNERWAVVLFMRTLAN